MPVVAKEIWLAQEATPESEVARILRGRLRSGCRSFASTTIVKRPRSSVAAARPLRRRVRPYP